MQLIGKDPSYYNDNSNKYTIEEWCELICTELEAGRPIPYHDLWEGHAWVLDGVDADGKFHMNWGFNGKFDGWFEINALVFNPYGDDEVWDFSQSSNSGNEMIINCFPYEGYVIPGETTYALGDVDHSGTVDIDDITALIAYVLNPTGSTIDTTLADLTGEGSIDVDDVVALITRVLGN